MNPADLRSLTLRDLPGPTRGLIAVFLVAIGCGYFAGLVQLHHQHAPPGSLMPGPEDAERIYYGQRGEAKSKILQLIEAHEGLPFNGTGTMKPAFTTKSEKSWAKSFEALKPEEQTKLLQEREGERLALIEWLRNGAKKDVYENDALELAQPLTLSAEFIIDKNGQEQATKVKVASIFAERCIRCHGGGADTKATNNFPMDEWKKLERYLRVEDAAPMDIKKLAQTTHVHLIGFTMMFFLTGLIFSFTNYPGWLKAIIAPWPMFFQVCDISLWWLGRYEPLAAQAILVTGGLVGIGFAIHIIGGLLDVTGIIGKRKT